MKELVLIGLLILVCVAGFVFIGLGGLYVCIALFEQQGVVFFARSIDLVVSTIYYKKLIWWYTCTFIYG